MFFQMLAGDVPFKGGSIPAIMKKHLTDAPPPLSQFGVQISPQIEAAVRHTLEKEPEKRTQTVEQMIGELKEARRRFFAKLIFIKLFDTARIAAGFFFKNFNQSRAVECFYK